MIPEKILRHLSDEGTVIRCAIWDSISLSPEVRLLVDTIDFQRLRRISQLGHVSLVYPGARHSRFEHSLGVHHLAKQFLQKLLKSTPPLELSEEDVRVFLAAALLHDIGHYPFSHILEEMNMDFFIHHEERGRRLIEDKSGELWDVLANRWGIDPCRVANVIDYKNKKVTIPERDRLLANILSGTLDPDKVDYLLRDSLYCGVPFGRAVNPRRLVESITYDPRRQRLAITSKGVAEIESLIFTNYQMYRNVYWHHGVRAAVVLFKRMVQEILLNPNCALRESDFERIDEHQLVDLLRKELDRLRMEPEKKLFEDGLRRRLYKVGRKIFPHEKDRAFSHIFFQYYKNPLERRAKETELAKVFAEKLGRDLGKYPILIDIPSFNKSLEIDLRVFFGDDLPDGCDDPISFDDPHVSRLKAYLVDNFEDHAKTFRIFCLPQDDLRDRVKREVKRLLS